MLVPHGAGFPYLWDLGVWRYLRMCKYRIVCKLFWWQKHACFLFYPRPKSESVPYGLPMRYLRIQSPLLSENSKK